MPNYSLIVNSQFHPFSYLEMISPVALATLSLQDLEDKYSTLADQSGVYNQLANLQTDPIAYKLYLDYSNDLSKQVEELNKNGLTPSARLNMLNMKRRYTLEIAPIDAAYKKREELIKEQRAIRGLDDSVMFDTDYSTTSLDKLLLNPNASYIPVSGNSLAKRAAEMAIPLSKVISPLTNSKLKTILGNLYALVQMGASPLDIMAAINNDANAHPELRKIIDNVYNTSGLDKFDAASLQKGMANIIRGLYSAIGGTNPVANGEYINKAQRASIGLLAQGLQLDRDKFNYAKKKDIQEMNMVKISHGLAPYATDKSGNKYFSNGKNSWIISPDGSYTKQNTGTTNVKTTGVTIKPTYFDAWSKGAHNGFLAKDDNDATGGKDVISYNDITGKEAKDYIRQYIRNSVVGASLLNDASIDRLASKVELYRDLDWLSDDHFVVNLPGIGNTGNENGKVINSAKYTEFINNVLNELANPRNHNNSGYGGNANAGLK